MKQLITTLGPKRADELGLILPHEHIFVDLGPIEEANYRDASAADVIPVMAPQIEAIKAQGVTALVECTPEGVGRRADIDLAVSLATDFPVVMPTGIYREPWVPQWAQDASEDELTDWLLSELTGEIGDTGVQAAWIKAQGVTALVECTPEGVGRRADIDLAVSLATDFPVVMPTGIYREPWVPQWAQDASEDALTDWLLSELTGEIGDTGVQAAWIKVSAGDDDITSVETKILRAAARAGAATGAIIGSHTIRGRVVRDQLDIIEDAGYTADRFIWIHTQAEPDTSLHLEMAGRGAWLEFDAIGSDGFSDDYFIDRILALLDAGFGEKLLLSHDRGWYDPSKPGGGVPNPYTVLVDRFLPALRTAGVDQATIKQLTHNNPFNAYAR